MAYKRDGASLSQKIAATVLSLLLCVSCFPLLAFATEGETPGSETVVTVEQQFNELVKQLADEVNKDAGDEATGEALASALTAKLKDAQDESADAEDASVAAQLLALVPEIDEQCEDANLKVYNEVADELKIPTLDALDLSDTDANDDDKNEDVNNSNKETVAPDQNAEGKKGQVVTESGTPTGKENEMPAKETKMLTQQVSDTKATSGTKANNETKATSSTSTNNKKDGNTNATTTDAKKDTAKSTSTTDAKKDESGLVAQQGETNNIASATVTPEQTRYGYTGSAITPNVTVKLGGTTLKKDTDYTVAYANNTNAGTASITVTGTGSYTGTAKASFEIVAPTVNYMAHVEHYGDLPWVSNGETAGTTGESYRMEAMRISLDNDFPVSGGITYRSHLRTTGWEDSWKSDGELSGTTGLFRRMEAVQIDLTGDMRQQYDVYYRAHIRRAGWMSWVSNGDIAGSTGMFFRMEALQIVILPKGATPPSNADSDTELKYLANPGVTYRVNVEGSGWQGDRHDGETAGTTGQFLRAEALQASFTNDNVPGNINYCAHVQHDGWLGWVSNGDTAGTEGRDWRMEAIRIALDGEAANYFDVWYRAHVQTKGWLGWANNGEIAGTTGAFKRMEALEIMLLPKGSDAPGDTDEHELDGEYFSQRSDPMYHAAQGYSSPTDWLVMVDCSTCQLGIFHGSQDNWTRYDKYSVGIGRDDSPSRRGVWSLGPRGYSFGIDYTCYYWISYYNDYLLHSIPFEEGTFDVQDGRLGEPVSAGCIRQPLEKARWLYNNVPDGTTCVVYDS